ncbi:hypothetical protein [Trueperella sp. LYQ143]|uniref:hypothetical protein n=1 Tax=Trueperella sp. LYQ143 TaxID=3391059 RepID=UPI003982EFB3
MSKFRSVVLGADKVRSVSRSTSVAVIALCTVMVPQIILRAVSYSVAGPAMAIGFFAAVISLAMSMISVRLLFTEVPRRSSHQLAERHIDHWAGLIVSAARILGYALIIILGVEIAVTSFNSVVNVSWSIAIEPAIIIAIAVIVFSGRLALHTRPIIILSFLALLGLSIVLGYAMIQELVGGVNFEEIRSARENALNTQVNMGRYHPFVEAALGGAMVGAVTIFVSERILSPHDHRRIVPRTLLKAMVPAVILIAVTLYFVTALRMPGRRVAIPSLSMAVAFFGRAGQIVLVVLYIVLGLLAAYSAYRQLPRLLRELAIDGLLPRRLAAKDAVRPRRMIVALIGLLAAAVTFVLDSTRSHAVVFVFTVFIMQAFTAVAMISRSKAILNESTDASKRHRAIALTWVFRGFFVLSLVVLAAVCYAQPFWAASGIVSLCVPVLFLLVYSRGQRKVNTRLELANRGSLTPLPTRVHGVVLIDRVDQASLRAVTWARSFRFSSLTAVCVDVDPTQTRQIRQAWQQAQVPVDLTILGEPKGAVRRPVIAYVRERLRLHPGDVVTVFIPRVIATGSWEQFFVRHSTPRIINDLRFEPGVTVCEVPYRLRGQGE